MSTATATGNAAKPLLLIVDDDPLIADTLSVALTEAFEVVAAHSRPQALSLLQQLREVPAIALVDLGLPPLPHRPDEGFALVSDLLAHSPAMRIVVLSGQDDASNARHARALGAIDFVNKPCHPQVLRQVLERAGRFDLTTPTIDGGTGFALIGTSLPMQRLRTQVEQYGEMPFPVLIEGESGSGKEIVARSLHFSTSRRARPFLALNCAAIAPTLVEPTLFGYAKGAFTGATSAKAGYFEEAAEGTLFLDEIGELPLELQAKLLRVLENGEYQRVGETQTRHARARIVAATNRDLKRAMKLGQFRTDLYHRLSVFTVGAPALRDMGEDRLLLLEHYRTQLSRSIGQAPFELTPEAHALWCRYAFPGNVRELRNIVIRLTASHAGRPIDAATLAQELDLAGADEAPDDIATTPGAPTISAASRRLAQPEPFALDRELARIEQLYIEAALEICHGNISQAARLLGINRTTLYSRIESSPPRREIDHVP